MPFQFLCPQGHLLEGIESQMGQQCQCPICGTAFIVPVIGAPPAPAAAQMYSPPPAYAPPAEPEPAGLAIVTDAPAIVPTEPAAAAAVEPKVEEKPKPDRIVRIPCPKGHELHTPMSMIGQDAMCPECGEQFTLRYQDSIEGKEEREKAGQEREDKINKLILRSAVGAAIVVGLAIVTMIILKIVR